jgi:TatD DNase family protein
MILRKYVFNAKIKIKFIMKNYLVDSHCHLNYEGLYEDLDGIVAEALSAGVGIMQTICTKISEVDVLKSIAVKYSNVFYSVGVHPLHVHEEPIISSDELVKLSKNDFKIIGFGETGLDYYRESETSILKIQRQSFENHIVAAQNTGLPVIIHTRDAEDDTYNMVYNAIQNKEFSGVLHCFTGSYNLAKKAVDLGLYISASGIITFKNADDIRDVFSKLPIDKILIETDSPYLAPIPYRGQVNKPLYVVEVAKKIAEIKNLSYEEVVSATTGNFHRLFTRVI